MALSPCAMNMSDQSKQKIPRRSVFQSLFTVAMSKNQLAAQKLGGRTYSSRYQDH
jgi:hypothetical protein